MVKHDGFFGSSLYHILVSLALLATLVFSIMAFYNSKQLKEFVIPKQIDTKDFMEKLKAHPEMQGRAQEPSNVVQVTSSNIQNLQAQIGNLDASFIDRK